MADAQSENTASHRRAAHRRRRCIRRQPGGDQRHLVPREVKVMADGRPRCWARVAERLHHGHQAVVVKDDSDGRSADEIENERAARRVVERPARAGGKHDDVCVPVHLSTGQEQARSWPRPPPCSSPAWRRAFSVGLPCPPGCPRPVPARAMAPCCRIQPGRPSTESPSSRARTKPTA